MRSNEPGYSDKTATNVPIEYLHQLILTDSTELFNMLDSIVEVSGLTPKQYDKYKAIRNELKLRVLRLNYKRIRELEAEQRKKYR